jgi:hypothetical protein
MPSYDKRYNINWEAIEFIDMISEFRRDLRNIRIALEEGKDLSPILFPPFDPLKTIGKYR